MLVLATCVERDSSRSAETQNKIGILLHLQQAETLLN